MSTRITRAKSASTSTAAPPKPQSKPKARPPRKQAKLEPEDDAADNTEKENKTKAKTVKGKRKTATRSKAKPTAKKTYCLCKTPDDGTPMVHCAECKDWYHFRCIDLSEKDAEDINVFICPPCTEKTGRRTAMEWEGPDAVEECIEVEAPTAVEVESDQAGIIEDQTEERKEATPEQKSELPPESGEDSDSQDDYISADKTKGREKNAKRRVRRLSYSSEDASESDGLSDDTGERRIRKRRPSATSPGPSLKRKQQQPAQSPPSKRKKASDTSADEDPARKYCLGKLEEVFRPIFLKYLLPSADEAKGDEDGMRVDKTPDEGLTDEQKEKSEDEAKKFATELEQCVYDIYSEVDKSGKPSVGAKYKERFRMLQFNLSKPDRIVLHKRIASSQIAPKELSLMSSTDLANEETQQSIKIAEKEALEHSILLKTAAPRAKITHKGLQDIEDINGEVTGQRDREREREQEEEERRERERMARLRAVQLQQRASSTSVPPESPVTPQSAAWGAPPPVPVQSGEQVMARRPSFGSRPPPSALFMPTSSELVLEPELNLADLINIDDESIGLDGPNVESSTSSALPSASGSGEADTSHPVVVSLPPQSPIAPTGISPFAANVPKPDPPPRSASFDLNSLWSGPKPDESTPPQAPQPPVRDEPKDVIMESSLLGEEADDQDFDMFLEEKDNAELDTSPEALQAAFDRSPQVWSGKINMPLDSTIPQETPVVARQMGGRSIQFNSPLWQILFPSELLRIDGRVPVDKSSQFLLQMRMNSAKELIGVAFSPGSEAADSGFRILTDFLIAKSRHGLVFPWGSRPKEHLPGKEFYIIPLLSSDPVPDYMELLDELRLPKIRKSNYLIGIWVLNKGKLVLPTAPPPPVVPLPAPPTTNPQPASINTIPGIAPLSAVVPPPPPSSIPLKFEPSALAAEVASLTPEQIQLMLRTLTAAAPIPLPQVPIATIPQQQVPIVNASQPWSNLGPGFGGGYSLPNRQQQPPYPAPFYDQRRDSRPGPSYERGGDHGERGWRGRGGRGRGRGRGRDGDIPKPVDSGWPRRSRTDSQGGSSSPTQGRW